MYQPQHVCTPGLRTESHYYQIESCLVVLLTVGRSYVGNDVTRSKLFDRASMCSYENPPDLNHDLSLLS